MSIVHGKRYQRKYDIQSARYPGYGEKPTCCTDGKTLAAQPRLASCDSLRNSSIF